MPTLTHYEKMTLGKLTKLVSLYFERPISQVMKGSTDDSLEMRYTVYWFAYHNFKISISAIQRFFGHNAHGTVINGLERIEEWRHSSATLRDCFATIEESTKHMARRRFTRQTTLHLNG